MNGKAFTILNTESFDGIFFRIMAAKTLKNQWQDSDIQTFLEREETKLLKEKPKVTYSMALVMDDWTIYHSPTLAVYLKDFFWW